MALSLPAVAAVLGSLLVPSSGLSLGSALSPALGPALDPWIQGGAPEAPSSLSPTPENLDAWAEFIRPSSEELTYESIGWRNAFWPAIEEARRLGRPVLLWTMNGHPLGCT